ncbi:MAG: RNA methyltransferase [Candidatus Methanoplasma sp.]|jgi:TrmH family RNA methyltransferase|nr:RNA methyltransferase [Candidatus Methanoplasma sp.]
MIDVRIVLVGPKFEGNVGAVARSMSNFGVSELYLVDPCPLGDDALRRSKHGSEILGNAKTVGSLEEALDGCFLAVATSGIVSQGDRNYARLPVSVREFAEHVSGYEEKIALIFGREDIGLYQDELNRCDVLIHVPSDESNPILNLSHAATIVMYELFRTCDPTRRCEPADRREKEFMFSFFENLMDAVDYPEARRGDTSVMFRRMMGRSIPTKYEYNTIMGIFGDAVKIIKYGKGWE